MPRANETRAFEVMNDDEFRDRLGVVILMDIGTDKSWAAMSFSGNRFGTIEWFETPQKAVDFIIEAEKEKVV